MKLSLLLISIAILFSGCDPGYRIYLCNSTSSEMYVKTYPLMESHYSKETSYRDLILDMKVGQVGNYGIYRINSNDTFAIDGSFGFAPDIKNIHFDYIAIIRGTDTLELQGKEEIFKRVKQMSKRKSKGNYYIEIEN